MDIAKGRAWTWLGAACETWFSSWVGAAAVWVYLCVCLLQRALACHWLAPLIDVTRSMLHRGGILMTLPLALPVIP